MFTVKVKMYEFSTEIGIGACSWTVEKHYICEQLHAYLSLYTSVQGALCCRFK